MAALEHQCYSRGMDDEFLDAQEREMMRKLAAAANGSNVYGDIDPSQLQAIRDFQEIQSRRRTARQADDRLEAEREAARMKMEIEAEKVRVQKAEVMIRAIEVAAASGVAPDKLLEVIQQVGDRLLPDSSLRPSLLLGEGQTE